MKKIPIQLVLGDGGAENRSVTICRFGEKESLTVSFDEFVRRLSLEVEEKR